MNETPKDYKALIILVMIYLSVTLAAGAMVNKTVVLGAGYVQGGTIITPLWYSIADVVTEIYGYKISRQILWGALISQFIFSVASFIIIHLPSPSFWHGQESYNFVFGNTLRIFFSGLIAFLVSGFINIYILSKWKILMLGKYFWLRSIGSSTFAEAMYTALIIPMITLGNISMDKILVLIASSYGLKIVYAVVIAAPLNMLVNYLKKLEGIDIYDYNVNFNPLLFGFSEVFPENKNKPSAKIINIRKYKTQNDEIK